MDIFSTTTKIRYYHNIVDISYRCEYEEEEGYQRRYRERGKRQKLIDQQTKEPKQQKQHVQHPNGRNRAYDREQS